MKIGIVVPFYNGHKYLERLVESFDHAADGFDCTLLIIDNSPTDLSVTTLYRPKIKVELVREKPGIGYGKACNRGYEICKERGMDYIIISNQDGYVSPGILKALVGPFQQDEKILISAPVLRVFDNNSVEDFFVKYYVSQVPEMVSDLIDGTSKSYYELKQISGACFAFNLKSSLFTYPNLFDPIYHMYSEDEDLCVRVLNVGGKIVLVTRDAIFYHKHSYTTDLDNQSEIEAGSLLSEKILRLKNGSRNFIKILYGVFVYSFSVFLFHFLRGKFKKAYAEIKSLVVMIIKIPAIKKSRRQDIIYSRKNG